MFTRQRGGGWRKTFGGIHDIAMLDFLTSIASATALISVVPLIIKLVVSFLDSRRKINKVQINFKGKEGQVTIEVDPSSTQSVEQFLDVLKKEESKRHE